MKNIIEKYADFIWESKNGLEYLALEYIKNIIKNSEFDNNIFLAGGAVRDELIGKDIKDIDLLINVENGGIKFAEWICKKLKIYKKDSNPVTYPKFGTAKFNLRGIKHKGHDLSEVDIECVMPRKEEYSDGSRKPEVSNGTLKDDVDRRDFTVNSLLKNLSTDEILDLTGMGKDDIKKGIVRTPLNPDVIFSEDPLRMLRAIRFTVKYCWDLPLFMIRSIKENSGKLKNISKERISSELDKMLVTSKPDSAIRLLQITGLSKYIFPELDNLIKLKQNKHHQWDAMKHTLFVLKNTPPDLTTRLAALFHDIGKADTKSIIDGEIHFYQHEDVGAKIAQDIMKSLKYPGDIIDAVVKGVKNHMRTKAAGDKAEISDKALRKLQLDLGPHLEMTLDLIHADNISHSPTSNMPNQIPSIKNRLKDLKAMPNTQHVKLPISGQDVIKHLGIKPGPIIKQLLMAVQDKWLENQELTREEALDIIEKEYKNLIK